MANIELTVEDYAPQYMCSECGNCKSVFGKSFCSEKSRGCCWYFPKFTLYEIHKMSHTKEGLDLLDKIIKLPKAIIYNYYIHAVGYFDEEGYKNYLETQDSNNYNVKDKTIFFRKCPFVKEGAGCTIPVQYRSYICNLFICEEVTSKFNKFTEYEKYLKERENFVRYIDWENNSTQELIEEKHLNLIDNYGQVIQILKEMPLENYEFPVLKPLEVV